MNPVASDGHHYHHLEEQTATATGTHEDSPAAQHSRPSKVRGKRQGASIITASAHSNATTKNQSDEASLAKVMLDGPVTVPTAPYAGADAIPALIFDDDMHAIASVHLRTVYPTTNTSIEYTETTTLLTEVYEDLDWVIGELRDVDEAQFSLANMRLRRLAMAKDEDDPERESLLSALSANDKGWTMTRKRLQTRERHIRANIDRLKDTLRALERVQLEEWEGVKVSSD
jgi:hypothetical protein